MLLQSDKWEVCTLFYNFSLDAGLDTEAAHFNIGSVWLETKTHLWPCSSLMHIRMCNITLTDVGRNISWSNFLNFPQRNWVVSKMDCYLNTEPFRDRCLQRPTTGQAAISLLNLHWLQVIWHRERKDIPFVLEGTSGAPMLRVSDFTASQWPPELILD